MATVVYPLCAVASAGCAVLLFRVFWHRRGRVRPLVLWTGLCFVGFAISNSLVVVDLVVLQNGALAVARAVTACAASAVLPISAVDVKLSLVHRGAGWHRETVAILCVERGSIMGHEDEVDAMRVT